MCQHTHCVGCEEDYNGAKIVYGQGNTIFKLMRNEFWDNGILVELLIENGKVKVNYFPYEDNGLGIKASDNKEISEGFYSRSKEIMKEGFVERNFKEYCKTQSEGYNNRIRSQDNATVFNMMTAEPHIEILREVLYLNTIEKITK